MYPNRVQAKLFKARVLMPGYLSGIVSLYMRCFWAYILGAIILYAGAVRAQNVSQQLDNRNGLSNSCVNSIYQDADHLIWFGTWDGLNYYDGANIHVFNYERADYGKRAIASNV